MATRDGDGPGGPGGGGDDPGGGAGTPDDGVPRGPWRDRVTFAPGGGFAYRPGEVIVRADFVRTAMDRITAVARARGGPEPQLAEPTSPGGRFRRVTAVPDALDAVTILRRDEGIAAQVNHVLFATSCGCPPHPASGEAEWYYADAAEVERVGANPYYANPYYANPYYANPYYANAGAGGCCCCRGGGMAGNPYYANPYYANPYYANPYYANADASPFANATCRSTGRRRSSARPAKPPEGHDDERDPVGAGVRVAILDTGWAVPDHAPVDHPTIDPQGLDAPDEAGDGFLDPAAGHGTFIAGVIDQLVPGCDLEVIRVLSTYGDGDESGIGDALEDLADDPPDIVNLSFGGYSPIGMDRLADAVRTLHDAGTAVVASAGNDATCLPMYPAILPEVVSVAALDEDEDAAPFTNYGPWVRACALGTDLVSWFFRDFNGAEPPVDGVDPDHFEGWAIWSGTSFAAPRVVAALASEVADGSSPHDAVADLVDAEDLERKAMLGTIVRTG